MRRGQRAKVGYGRQADRVEEEKRVARWCGRYNVDIEDDPYTKPTPN